MTTDKKIIAFSALIIAFSILYYFVYFIPNSEKEESSLGSQKICADGAKRYFDKIFSQDETMAFHYNSKLDKCFLVTDILYRNTTSNSNERIKVVYDVFEETKYGYLTVNFQKNITLCSLPELGRGCNELDFNKEVSRLLQE